jgi:hypothetical protein
MTVEPDTWRSLSDVVGSIVRQVSPPVSVQAQHISAQAEARK